MERYLEKYTEQRQKRREQRRKRQKRTGLGLTASRLLKSIPLTKGQGVKLAVVQPFSQREQIKPSFVSKRFPALCAIGLHLIAMLIATRYVVFQSQVIDDDQIMVEMFEAHQVQQRRRMRARTFKSIESPSTYPRNVLQSKPKITTTVEILRSESAFTKKTRSSRGGKTYQNRFRDSANRRPATITCANHQFA